MMGVSCGGQWVGSYTDRSRTYGSMGDSMLDIILYLLLAIGINVVIFIPAFVFQTDKLTDMSYSLTFILLVCIAFALSKMTSPQIIITCMILIWALRLGLFLVIRIRRMGRDKRFDGIRESFGRFIRFWLLQGLSVWIISLPALFFITSEGIDVFMAGLAIWLAGIIIETTADIQKYQFTHKSENKGRFIDVGLWAYSRHPNYFGEILCWIGVYVYAYPSLTLLENLFGAASPLFITILLLFVTGIPPLERYADRKWGKERAYKEYKRTTSVLIPWFKKR